MSSSRFSRDFKGAQAALNTLMTNTTVLQHQEQVKHENNPNNFNAVPYMKNQLERCEIDFDKLNVLHVSGTKGKGSTCAMVESVLRNCGYKTGLYTSPHLTSVCERFRIGGQVISEERFAKSFWHVWDSLHATKDNAPKEYQKMPMYFRYLTIMAMHMFLEENVGAAVMEVGLGGRFDATNVFSRPVVCGVASLGLDHTGVLGNTIEEIAVEKAGIIKNDRPVFTLASQQRPALAVLRAKAQSCNAPLVSLPPLHPSFPVGLPGDHQRENAALALHLACRFIAEVPSPQQPELSGAVQQHLEHLPITTPEALPPVLVHGLRTARWDGRCQHVQPRKDRDYFIDGAHTTESLLACAKWFGTESQKPTFHLVHAHSIVQLVGERAAGWEWVPLAEAICQRFGAHIAFRSCKDSTMSLYQLYEFLLQRGKISYHPETRRITAHPGQLCPHSEHLPQSADTENRSDAHADSENPLRLLIWNVTLTRNSTALLAGFLRECESEYHLSFDHIIFSGSKTKNDPKEWNVGKDCKTGSKWQEEQAAAWAVQSGKSREMVSVSETVDDAVAAVERVASACPARPVHVLTAGSLYLAGGVLGALRATAL